MDFIREILLKVEADSELDGTVFKTYEVSDFDGHSEDEIAYHARLLLEAGLVDGDIAFNPVPSICRLTWQGHEFIGATKDPRIWDNVKERLKGFPDVAVSIVWEIAKAEARKHLGFPP